MNKMEAPQPAAFSLSVPDRITTEAFSRLTFLCAPPFFELFVLSFEVREWGGCFEIVKFQNV